MILEFDRSPSLLSAYLKAMGGGSSSLSAGHSIPHMQAVQRAANVDLSALKAYCKVCEFKLDATLPITYPHILASPLQMALLSHKQFPLKLMGLVHVRNVIHQHRAIALDEQLDIRVWVEGHRDVHNGLEFDMMTEITDALGNRLWDSVSTMLSRGKPTGKGHKPAGKKPKAPALPQLEHECAWHVPDDIGRRYAKVSGDINPIHMHALSAKLFGFPRAIAHGMWSLAHAAADMQADFPAAACTLEVAFKRPVLLPASAVLRFGQVSDGLDYRLHSKDGKQLHMAGSVKAL